MTETLSPREALAFHLSQVDRWTKQAIIDELAEAIPALTANEERAARNLRDAVAALELPQRELDALGDEVTRARVKAGEYRSRADDTRLETRVEARAMAHEYDAEITRLENKLQQARDAMQPFLDDRDAARAGLELARNARRALAYAMLLPFEGLGQGTHAYIAYRQPYINHVLLKGDDRDPEWETAMTELRELCLSSGYRTDDLPADSEAYRNFWDKIRDDANPPEPAPTGRQVHDAEIAALQSTAMNKSVQSPSKIEDFRRPPATQVARWRQVQRLSGEIR